MSGKTGTAGLNHLYIGLDKYKHAGIVVISV